MTRYQVDVGCPIIPFVDKPKACNRCGRRLSGRRTQWCSSKCENEFRENHNWTSARHAAKDRDGYRCVRCGSDGRARVFIAGSVIEIGMPSRGPERYERRLEVNHITPREGQGYGWGCAHHLDGLETLCRHHHQIETNKQAARRRQREAVAS
ncbi:HNH endonuclease [Mycolicibacterium fortuitum]|uniref:HNH endonuclease n=1 Tax=Mycolicibacterium fortuitum TaxID=1766 RepID=UPI001CDD47A7|nr:hypothetical protein [Mycolicibacterium fortuitum]UBV14847.1 hypothetical protein H8Z57_29840 [Mycolicibacterium fortuitum]